MKTATLPPNPDPVLNVAIRPELVEKHGLTPEEYEHILQILGREPNLTELGIFSVMWSEHCSYKNSRRLLKQFPVEKQSSKSPNQVLVRAGEENAGVIDIGDGWAVCFKIESHNHPSAIEPFEGAATGVGGIIRDIFTMGARPVLVTNSLRFGELTSPLARRLFRGVVSGIAHYGNCIGIPNVGGDVYFDPCYEGNPLVNALCLGVLRHDEIKRGAASGVGNPVYYVGADTGRDGLGGASFASRELSEESSADRPAVQKGDPFMEKLLLEACLEMMAIEGLVVGIQDMGAAGLTCSTCETAARGNTGIEIELDHVPQRESGMNSYEIMLSESQERMLVIVTKGREKELEAVFEKWDLHATQVGEVTDGGMMAVKQHGELVAEMPAAKLTDEAPLYAPQAREPEYLREEQDFDLLSLPDLSIAKVGDVFKALLSNPTIASKQWIWQQYDHMVIAGTVVIPGSDAAVVRLRLDEGKEKYIAIANDGNSRYCRLDPKLGGQIAIVECLRNLACSGARPLAMTNNLNFGNPQKPESFYMMKEAIGGLAEACQYFDVPVVGGNVSLYNESPELGIDPSPVVSIVGIIDRAEDITTQFIKNADLNLVLLGGVPHEIGASQYLKQVYGLKVGRPPAVDFAKEKSLADFLREQIGKNRVAAAHDISEGGLLVAIAEMLFDEASSVGAHISLSGLDAARLDGLLFGETQGLAIVAVDNAGLADLLNDARQQGVVANPIGVSTPDHHLSVKVNDDMMHWQWELKDLYPCWKNAISDAMEVKS